MFKTQALILPGVLLACATGLPWTSPVARAEVEAEAFEIGGSCAALAYSTLGQLRMLLTTVFPDDLHSFCFPEEAVECSEYTPLFKGEGKLVTGEDGYHCTMIITP